MHVCVPITICQDLTSCLLLANMGKMSMDLLQWNSAERYNILFNTFSRSAHIGISYRIEGKNFISVTLDRNMALRKAGGAIEFKCHGGFQNFSSRTTILKILKFCVKTTLEGDRLSRAPRLSRGFLLLFAPE